MIIYKTTNLINSKIYIGRDKQNNPEYLGSGKLVCRAFKKYGKQNFKKEILEYCLSEEQLNEKEIFWIKKLNSTNKNIGYNITIGGEGGDTFTNNPDKEKTRMYCRQRKGKNNGMFNKKHNEESLQKMRENRKGIGKGKAPWNKGKQLHYRDKMGLHGSKNGMAKTFIFISPDKINHIVIGEFEKFCKENKLDIFIARYFINKGKIPVGRSKKDYRINLIGWEIIS